MAEFAPHMRDPHGDPQTSPQHADPHGLGAFLEKTIQESHVDRRVVGWSAGRHVDHACGGRIPPWPARKVTDFLNASYLNAIPGTEGSLSGKIKTYTGTSPPFFLKRPCHGEKNGRYKRICLIFRCKSICTGGGVQNQAEKNSKNAFRPVPVQQFSFPVFKSQKKTIAMRFLER